MARVTGPSASGVSTSGTPTQVTSTGEEISPTPGAVDSRSPTVPTLSQSGAQYQEKPEPSESILETTKAKVTRTIHRIISRRRR